MTRAGLVLRGAVLAVACAVGLLIAVLTRADPPAPAVGGDAAGALLPPGIRAPATALRDERGRSLSLAGLRGPAIVAFATADCAQTCDLTAQTMRGAIDRAGGDVPAVIVAVDPARDTPARARRFLREQRVAGRIRFALGSPGALQAVWRAFAVQPQTATEHHQARIVLLDARGMQRIGYFTAWATPEAIADDVRRLRAG